MHIIAVLQRPDGMPEPPPDREDRVFQIDPDARIVGVGRATGRTRHLFPQPKRSAKGRGQVDLGPGGQRGHHDAVAERPVEVTGIERCRGAAVDQVHDVGAALLDGDEPLRRGHRHHLATALDDLGPRGGIEQQETLFIQQDRAPHFRYLDLVGVALVAPVIGQHQPRRPRRDVDAGPGQVEALFGLAGRHEVDKLCLDLQGTRGQRFDHDPALRGRAPGGQGDHGPVPSSAGLDPEGRGGVRAKRHEPPPREPGGGIRRHKDPHWRALRQVNVPPRHLDFRPDRNGAVINRDLHLVRHRSAQPSSALAGRCHPRRR